MALIRPLPDPLVELIAHRLRVLGQPLRIRIVDELDQTGETTVQALSDGLGASQQNVSKHLGVLHAAGVLRRRREGRVVWYELADADAASLLLDVGEGMLRQLRQLDDPDRP